MQQTRYTNRQIWHIAYPILISLIMEQMIGMTDTAFLGRVGEVELGAWGPRSAPFRGRLGMGLENSLQE